MEEKEIVSKNEGQTPFARKGISAVVIIAVLAGLAAVLDIVGVIGIPAGFFGVSAFYIASAFYICFIYWFNWKGALGIYIGLLIASFFTGGFTLTPLLLAWGNVFAPAAIVYLMKLLKRSPSLKNTKDILVFIPLAILAPAVSAFWILGGFVIFGIMPAAGFWASFAAWMLGGAIVNTTIGTALLKTLSPVVKKLGF